MSAHTEAAERTPTRPEDLPEGVDPIIPASAVERSEKQYCWHIGDGDGRPRCSYVDAPRVVSPTTARRLGGRLCRHCAQQQPGVEATPEGQALLRVEGIGDRRRHVLCEIGITTLADLRAASIGDLLAGENIDWNEAIELKHAIDALDAEHGGAD